MTYITFTIATQHKDCDALVNYPPFTFTVLDPAGHTLIPTKVMQSQPTLDISKGTSINNGERRNILLR